MDTPKSIVVIALTPGEELVLVKIYRHNLRGDYFELPAGGAEHNGETVEQAAKRELLEETGYGTDKMVNLGSYYVLPSETSRWTSFFLKKLQVAIPQKS